MRNVTCYQCIKNKVYHKGFVQWMWPNLQFPADLVTFTEEILYGKLYFLCSIYYRGVFRTLPNIYSKASLQKLLTTKNCYLQSDLPVAYMLYSGHLKIVDTFSWNQPNHLMLFLWENKKKLLFDFQMLSFDTLFFYI